ncbi:MAG: lactate utilization protein [Desulfovibrio sp.]|nr:lactate utilization protein [Desulfovibrio sp.]
MSAAADPKSVYWQVKLEKVKTALEGNGFTVSIHTGLDDAARHVTETVVPREKPRTVGFGGSQTVLDSGVLERIRDLPGIELLDARAPGLSTTEIVELRRRMLLSDLYFSSSNALTMDGKLVNRDCFGNRVGALHFGPRKVVLLIGRNKICASVEEAVTRVRTVASPMNSLRLRRDTPCVKTGVCMDCKSPDRICSVWTLTEKCFPRERIHIQIINAEAGF